MVAERVRELGVQAEICTGESLALIEAWSQAGDVVLVDAVVTGAPVGKVWLWDGGQVMTHGSISISTHGYGVAEAIKLARILDRLPKRLRVFGIEGRLFDFGSEISAEVMCAVEDVVEQITAEAVSEPARLKHLERESGKSQGCPRTASPCESEGHRPTRELRQSVRRNARLSARG
jgi:hydrogenase maturation protease